MQLKINVNAKDIENLYIATVSGQQYYFTGDLGELQSAFINAQGLFKNFYPYQDTKLVNDIEAFDDSVVRDFEGHGRDAISALGFSEIIPYVEDSVPELEEVTPELEENIPELGDLPTDILPEAQADLTESTHSDFQDENESEPQKGAENAPELITEGQEEIDELEPSEPVNEEVAIEPTNETKDITLEDVENMNKTQILESLNHLGETDNSLHTLNKATLKDKLIKLIS